MNDVGARDDEIRMFWIKRIEIDRFELWSLFRAAGWMNVYELQRNTDRICWNRKQNNSHSIVSLQASCLWMIVSFFVVVLKSS